MSEERYRPRCGLHLLLFNNEGQILLLRRSGTGFWDGYYSLPAGHLEEHESVTTGTAREAGEEIGVTIRTEDLEIGHVMQANIGQGRIYFFFAAKKWQGVPENREPDKCDELRWADPDHLPEDMVPYVGWAIACFMKDVFFSEFGWDEVVVTN